MMFDCVTLYHMILWHGIVYVFIFAPVRMARVRATVVVSAAAAAELVSLQSMRNSSMYLENFLGCEAQAFESESRIKTRLGSLIRVYA